MIDVNENLGGAPEGAAISTAKKVKQVPAPRPSVKSSTGASPHQASEASAGAVQKGCSAVDESCSPAIRCELPEGHEGKHQWTHKTFPKGMESKKTKTW